MASPSYTYTLTNGTTASATEVMQNFNDVLNGITDGTKDLNISALTCAGAIVMNGNTTIGSNTSDTLTINALLASSISPNADATLSLGTAALGFDALYLGDGSGNTTKVESGASSDYTLTLPASAGTAQYVPETNGTGALTFVNPWRYGLKNVSFSASVAANALTIGLKGFDGANPSSTNTLGVMFRDATATTGTPVVRHVTSAVGSLTISSGSTLGHTSGKANYIYVYLIDNAGSVILGASSTLFDEGTLRSSTAEGGAGAADSAQVLYANSAVSSKAIRLIGRLLSNQVTAGTWATAPSELSLLPFSGSARHEIAAHTTNGYGSVGTKIRRFTTISVQEGTAVTVAQSASSGDSFTVNQAGNYAISYTEGGNAAMSFGISLNASDLTTGIVNLVAAEVLQLGVTSGNDQHYNVAWTGWLAVGDVVRAQTDGATDPGSTGRTKFVITKI